MNRRASVASILLFVVIAGAGAGLTASKCASLRAEEAAAASQPEPMESVTAAVARERAHRRTTTSIGTVLALRSITLRNELAGTVRQASLTPGQVVDAGTVLVALDVAVEEAELRAQEAQAALAETLLAAPRTGPAGDRAASDRAWTARAPSATSRWPRSRAPSAIIARKTIRAPFRARVGMADVHPGQYLDEGTELTTLQGVDDAAHVDFAVAQRVAAGPARGRERGGLRRRRGGSDRGQDRRDRRAGRPHDPQRHGARADRGAARAGAGRLGARRGPGRPAQTAVAVPVSALRKGPSGDHVFVLAPDKDGKTRAHLRQVAERPDARRRGR